MNVKLISFLEVSLDLQLKTRNWRNQENVIPYFKIKNIREDMHLDWLKSMKSKKPKTIAFLIKIEEHYVGVTYFSYIDYVKRTSDWGIYIHDEKYRGKGVGKQVLMNCISYAKEEILIDVLFLDVLKTNVKAVRLYENCGFKKIDEENLFCRYQLIL